MKKILAILLIFVVALGLFAGCGAKEKAEQAAKQAASRAAENAGQTDPTGGGYDPDPYVPNNETPGQTDPPANGGNENSGTNSFAQDLSEAAAAWSQIGQMFNATWPENEFTKQVPKPNFEIALGIPDESSYTAAFSNATVETLKDYVKDLRRAGFTQNEDTQEYFGYSFSADNGKYRVEVLYTGIMNAITITRLS